LEPGDSVVGRIGIEVALIYKSSGSHIADGGAHQKSAATH